MAESKVDYSQLIGFLFLMAAFVSFLFISPPVEDEIDIQSEENVAINDSFNVNQDSRANQTRLTQRYHLYSFLEHSNHWALCTSPLIHLSHLSDLCLLGF